LFGGALSLHDKAARRAYLRRECHGNQSLFAEVEELLAEIEVPLPEAPTQGSDNFPARHPVESLLRRWMVPGALITGLGFGVFLAKNCWDGTYNVPSCIGRNDQQILFIAHVFAVAVPLSAAFFMWIYARRSLVILRCVEIAIVLSATLFFVQFQRTLFHQGLRAGHARPVDPMDFDALDETNDGVYVPNSFRRWAVVTAAIFAVPIIVTYVVDFHDLDRSDRLIESCVWLGIAAVLAASGPLALHRLEAARTDARRFGDYRLVRRLGQGTMGVVFLAEHWLHQGRAAVKIINADLLDHPEQSSQFKQKFKQEIEALANFNHQNVVRLIAADLTEDGILYFVMEYVSGRSLKEIVEAYGAMQPDRVAHILTQLCSALNAAHENNVIHRDIKPNNIMISPRDVVKVLDFGIAMSIDPLLAASSASFAGMLSYSSDFTAPEQRAGGDPIPASDVYGVGATGYYLLTGLIPGNVPPEAEDWAEHAKIVPLQRLFPDMPVDIAEVIAKCLRKDPATRYQNMEELAADLSVCGCAKQWDKRRAVTWWEEHPCGDSSFVKH
jgi:hypothetical protein